MLYVRPVGQRRARHPYGVSTGLIGSEALLFSASLRRDLFCFHERNPGVTVDARELTKPANLIYFLSRSDTKDAGQ